MIWKRSQVKPGIPWRKPHTTAELKIVIARNAQRKAQVNWLWHWHQNGQELWRYAIDPADYIDAE